MHLLSAGDVEHGLRVMLDEHADARARIASLEQDIRALTSQRDEARAVRDGQRNAVEVIARERDTESAKVRELVSMVARALTACEERDTCQVCRASYGPEQLRTHCEEHLTPDDLDSANRDACEDWTAMMADARALLTRLAQKTEGA